MKRLLPFALLILIASCCPRITALPPVISDTEETEVTSDTDYTMVKELAEAHTTIEELWDQVILLRNQPPDTVIREVTVSRKQQGGLTASLKVKKDQAGVVTIAADCKYDSLQAVINTLSRQIRTHKEQTTTVVEQCPYKWPAWIHPIVALFAVIGLALLTITALRLTGRMR